MVFENKNLIFIPCLPYCLCIRCELMVAFGWREINGAAVTIYNAAEKGFGVFFFGRFFLLLCVPNETNLLRCL